MRQRMKIVFALLMAVVAGNTVAQSQLSTNQLTIIGKVKNEKVLTLDEIRKFPSSLLSDVNTSCSPRKTENSKSLRVVLLKNILDSVKFSYESSKTLGQFYFLFVSSDNYKTVFSFNEIYNTETGNQLYIVTEMDGKKMEELENRILLLSTGDIKGGARNMKGLSRIEVRQAE